MLSSRGFSWSRDWTQVSYIAGRFFTVKPPGKPFETHSRHQIFTHKDCNVLISITSVFYKATIPLSLLTTLTIPESHLSIILRVLVPLVVSQMCFYCGFVRIREREMVLLKKEEAFLCRSPSKSACASPAGMNTGFPPELITKARDELCSFHSVQSLSCVRLIVTPWTAARQASLSITNSCPLSQWCHPTISSSVIPFSSRLQSFPASESFQISQLFPLGGQSIRVSASAWVPTMNIQHSFTLGWTG